MSKPAIYFDKVLVNNGIGRTWVLGGVNSHHRIQDHELARAERAVITSTVLRTFIDTETGSWCIETVNTLYIQRVDSETPETDEVQELLTKVVAEDTDYLF